MTLLKHVMRLEYMDQLIRTGRAGNAKEFADKICISVAQLKEELRQMRELGACIEYDRQQRSYIYKNGCALTFKFSLKEKASSNPDGR